VQVKAFVELVSSLLSASITNPSSQDGASPPGLAGEMLRVMKEAGVLKGLTNALKLVDTDHPQVDWKPCAKPAQQGISSRQAC
jgi:hypothetical protein